jgi:methionine-rich copper-binding protein CopC
MIGNVRKMIVKIWKRIYDKNGEDQDQDQDQDQDRIKMRLNMRLNISEYKWIWENIKKDGHEVKKKEKV